MFLRVDKSDTFYFPNELVYCISYFGGGWAGRHDLLSNNELVGPNMLRGDDRAIKMVFEIGHFWAPAAPLNLESTSVWPHGGLLR